MEKIEAFPIASIRECPFNPRKSYPEAQLQELADSIAAVGLMQPIVVRLLTPPDGQHQYEVVFGHRRFRALQRIGAAYIDAVLREMDDKQAAIAQAHENAKREDVSPFEEADSYDRLMYEHGMSGDDVAKAVGVSRSQVYARLKLRRCCQPVRDAVATGLPIDVAERIGRMPGKAVQLKALDAVRELDWVDGKKAPVGWLSARAGKAAITNRGTFFIPIVEAKFDTHDGMLLDGVQACTECEHRSANDPSAEGEDDVCADTDCFDRKTRETHAREARRLKAQGHNVLEGEAAAKFKPSQWSDPLGYCSLGRGVRTGLAGVFTVNDLLARRPDEMAAPTLTYIVKDDGSLLGFIKSSDADALLKALAPASEDAQGSDDDDDDDSGDQYSDEGDDDDDQVEPPPERVAVTRNWGTATVPAILRAAAARPRTTDDMRYIAAHVLDTHDDEAIGNIAEAMGWGEEVVTLAEDGKYGEACEWALAKLPTMTADQLGLMILLLALQSGPVTGDDYVSARINMARHYGVLPPAEADAAAITPEPTASSSATEQEQLQLDGLPPAPHDEDDDDDDEPQPAATPGKPKANTARYRNPATGETWSGRGLQPKWLKAAIAAGNKLTDYLAEGVAA